MPAYDPLGSSCRRRLRWRRHSSRAVPSSRRCWMASSRKLPPARSVKMPVRHGRPVGSSGGRARGAAPLLRVQGGQEEQHLLQLGIDPHPEDDVPDLREAPSPGTVTPAASTFRVIRALSSSRMAANASAKSGLMGGPPCARLVVGWSDPACPRPPRSSADRRDRVFGAPGRHAERLGQGIELPIGLAAAEPASLILAERLRVATGEGHVQALVSDQAAHGGDPHVRTLCHNACITFNFARAARNADGYSH